MVQSDIPQQNVEFLSRVANIPVVHSAIEYATDAYIKAKDSSPTLLKKTWSTAEDTVNYAARCALPMVHSIEGTQVAHVVDQLACKTLDKVEESLPVMTKTPEEIMTTTRSYVNNKMQPVSNTVSILTDTLLSNPLGRLALGSVEMSVSTVHNCIDFLLPPGADEDTAAHLKSAVVPLEPSEKIVWSVRRSFDAIFKVQHRLFHRANQVLHAMSLNGLLILGTVVDLFEWVQQNWKDLTLKSLPVHLNNLANAYRKSSGIDARPVDTLEDVVFLSSFLINRAVEIIRGALSIVTNLVETQPIRALRLQLSIALATSLDFISRIVRVVSSKNALEEANLFLEKDFPTIHGALMTVKGWTEEPNVKVKSA